MPWSRADPAEYAALDLHVHEILGGVPLHDVWQIDLAGGGPGRTVSDLLALLRFESLQQINPVVRGLFRLRSVLGTLFGWDRERSRSLGRPASYSSRVPAELRERSIAIEPEGPFVPLYTLPGEAVSEVRNATVHAFMAVALEPRGDDYRAWWAIYVAPVGAITAYYMALIDPFRRWLVYPAILRHVERGWTTSLSAARR